MEVNILKILFIGGTGRLSKDVAELAAKNENTVYLLTRGSADRTIFVKDSYNMIYGNIRNINECRNVLENHFFDVIIDFLSFNVKQLKDTLNIIKGKYTQYIFISSATIYDGDNGEIISEYKTKTGNSKWSYANNKWICEKYVNEYFENSEEKYTIIRPYVTYGNTRVPYPLVPRRSKMEWTFIDRILNEKPVPVFDNGRTITTLTHTKDFAKAVVGVMGNELAFGECVHITNDSTTTWGAVLDNIEIILNKNIKRMNFETQKIVHDMPEYKGVLYGDKSKNMLFDNGKIKKMVPSFVCEISLQNGLKDMIEFYLNHTELQKVDFMWNGSVDRLCNLKSEYEKYKFKSLKDKINYFLGYNYYLHFIYVNLKNLYEKIH